MTKEGKAIQDLVYALDEVIQIIDSKPERERLKSDICAYIDETEQFTMEDIWSSVMEQVYKLTGDDRHHI